MKLRALQSSLVVLFASAVVMALASSGTGQEPAKSTPTKPKKVVKTDAEWKKLLPRESYLVTRHAETEAAFTGKLVNNHARGVYECICCETPLFSSRAKFDSGTGWPSFDAPYNRANVSTSTDYKLGYPRTEVTCSVCDAHLGHVFDDGPTNTGLRFCMNSAALKFVKEAPPAAKSAAKGKTTEKVEKTTEKAEKAEAEKKDDKAEKSEKKDAPAAESPK